MSQEVQTHAERILVHSGAAVEALELDRLPGESTAATEVMGYGIPAARPAESPGGGEDGHLVVSQAVDSDIEATELLLHGFSELVSRLPGARLAVIGSLGEEARDGLGKTASQLGIDGSTQITEPLGGEEYWRALAEADLAVQLRTNSEGEASAAVCDCLAARLPTVVSDVGWFRQIPAPAVLAVPPDCPPAELAEQMASAIEDDGLRDRIRAAQDEHAAANSFSRVAERFAEALSL
jgi:hypothetical protein